MRPGWLFSGGRSLRSREKSFTLWVTRTLPSETASSVWGHSSGIGVRGSGGTHGVDGIGTNGYGGQFQGGKAQLRIVPKPAGNTGPPSGSHSKGEIYMDSQADLYVCTAGGATPTWKQVQWVVT